MDSEIWASEQDYLATTLQAMSAAQERAASAIKAANGHVDDVTKSWSDVRLKTDSYSGIVETAMSIRQQQQLLAERENAKSHSERQYATLTDQLQRPYFARVDFSEQHAEQHDPDETIYIGLASFSDDQHRFFVYDWRAPVASIYYDGGIGTVMYQTPDGEQAVDVSLKRQFQIDDGQLTTLFDTEEAIGDAMLRDALSQESSPKMSSIVTTIQRVQNQIIRDTKSDLLFVQGAAGSGKTAAVLQRIAYLLYRYRGKLTSGQVVLFSPNQLFNDYIDQVLPELGEQNMVQVTLYQYVARRLPKLKIASLAERFTQDHQQPALNRLLGSLAMFQAVAAYAEHLNRQDVAFRHLMFRGEPLITKDKIAQIYYQYNANYRLGQRLSATTDALRRSLNQHLRHEMTQDWVDLEIENLSKQEYDELVGAGKVRLGDDSEDDAAAKTRAAQLGPQATAREFKSERDERRFLAKAITTEAMRPLARQISRGAIFNITAQFVDFLKHMPDYLDLTAFGVTEADWQAHVGTVIDDLRNHRLGLNEAMVYIYLYDLMSGKHGDREIRFLFIDEMQDYTPFQMGFLRFSFPNAKFTVLGDLNQAIFSSMAEGGVKAALAELFSPEATRAIQLTQTYRSTQQITDFTSALLVDGERIDAFNRQGDRPEVLTYDDETAMLAALPTRLARLQQTYGTVAIITKTLADSQRVHEQLEALAVTNRLVHSENQRLTTGVLVMPSYLAKGLEFDAVVAWHADQQTYPDVADAQLFYTVASRAMHALTLMAEGAPTPLLDRVDANLYC